MNQKIIIIDGIDKVGKTTIAAALSKEIGIPVFKRKNVKKNYDFIVDLFYSIESYLQFLEQTRYSVIFDRLYPSEYAYSRALGRITSLAKIIDIDKRFSALGAYMIILNKSIDKHLNDEIIPIELYDKINDGFMTFVNKYTFCKTLILNTSDENLEKQLEQIKDFISWTSELQK